MTTQAPAATVGQFIEADTEVHFPSVYYAVRLPADGSRRVIARRSTRIHITWADEREALLTFADGDPIVLWGVATNDMARALDSAAENGWYLPYPPDDGTVPFPVEYPPNQIPFLRAFLNHCCTFAHELLTNHEPHSPRLRDADSWNIATDITLDVATINQNRVGMRYYRGVLGYFYDRVQRFEAMPNNPEILGPFEEDWRVALPDLQSLDRYVCGECQDEAGGSRLRDFIHYCNVAAWDAAMDAIERLPIGDTIQYRGRLPRIDRSNPDDLRPHLTANVRDWISNVPNIDGGWRGMMRDFDAAVKRYDRDPSVRVSG